MASKSKKKKDILIYGAWPDPRSSGISSVVHDTITSANKEGRTVFLLTEGFDTKERLGPLSIKLMKVDGDKPFDWKETVKHIQEFHSLEELVKKDAAGHLNEGKQILDKVGLIHNHSDDLIPHYNINERNCNNYNTLISHIQAISGKKPALVRTRHDDAYQIGIDRLSRLTGLDWKELPIEEKLAYYKDGSPLKEIVEQHVKKNREELKQKYMFDDEYLNNAIDHVWWVMHKLRLWRQEAKDADAVVCLTDQDVAANKELVMPDKKNTSNFATIYNGSSFAPQDMGKIHGLLYEFHTQQKLECYRGGSQAKEGIKFKPEDKKVIFVGRAHQGKGIYELARSLGKLYKKGHKNIRGIFVGDFDEETRKKLAELDPENSKEYLLFTGRVNDPDQLAAILAFGNVTAIPSYYESFNLTGIESLKMGTPLVVTDFSGPGDVYIKNPQKQGVKIALPVSKPFKEGIDRYFGVDEESLAKQIETVITNDGLAYQLGQDGKKFVEEHYSHTRMGEEYAELYEKLLKKQSKKKSKKGNSGEMNACDTVTTWMNCKLYNEKPFTTLEAELSKSKELSRLFCYMCKKISTNQQDETYRQLSQIMGISQKGRIEEAQMAADWLIQEHNDFADAWHFKAINYARDKRFEEARDALVTGFKIAKTNREMTPELQSLLEENYNQLTKLVRARKRKKVYDEKFFKNSPDKKVELDTTYVLLADENLENNIQDLLSREKEEKFDIVIVKDNISGLSEFTEKYKDRLATVETEHKIWEKNKYNTDRTNGLIRIVLKNNNNGYLQRGLNMGIRKAIQSGSKNIKLVGYNNEIADALLELDSKRTLGGAAKYQKLDMLVQENKHLKAPTKVNTKKGNKKTVVFVGTTKNNTHGVPVVMNNIRTQLEQNPDYAVFSLINSFDDHKIMLYDQDGNCQTFLDRKDFVKFAKERGFKIDLMHIHSWHVADSYVPFHAKIRDNMPFAEFLEKLGKPKTLFTDHCNPLEILSRIKEHNDVEYDKLSDEGKAKFIKTEDLNKHLEVDWLKGWQATQIKCTREIMDIADAVVHVSGTQLDEEIKKIMPGLDPAKHSVIYNGLDLAKFADDPAVEKASKQLKEKYGLKDNEKVVLYAGRPDKEKGVFDLADAVKMLEHNSEIGKIKLIYLGNMDKMKTKLGNGKANILFPGRIDDRKELAAHYKMADVVVQPTWGECFNQVIGEGLAMGTPGIISDVSGPAEVYVSKGVAVGCKPKDPEDLAEKIKTVLTNKQLKEELGQKGKKYIQEHLSVESMYKQYLAMYDKLIAQ